MDPAVPASSGADARFSRRGVRVALRGASSHFVGSAIAILSSYAVATLAMNRGKKIQARKLKGNPR